MSSRYFLMLVDKFIEVAQEIFVEVLRRAQCQPALSQPVHLGVVVALRTSVGVTTPLMPAEVSVEIGADMPQFMDDRRELLLDLDVHEPRQIEAQNVKIFLPRRIEKAVDAVPPTANLLDRGAIFKAQRSERSVETVCNVFPRLAHIDRHPSQIDMAQFVKAINHIRAEPTHCSREVESVTLHGELPARDGATFLFLLPP
jgi:hypothetical protein